LPPAGQGGLPHDARRGAQAAPAHSGARRMQALAT